MNELAPVVLFVYNRVEHTKKTLDALSENTLAKKTDLIIYSDAARESVVEKSVNEVRNVIRQYNAYFSKIRIIERDINFGLASSIIDGVTQIINEYGKVIVLEDDLITSAYFLEYMNDALNLYQNKKKVMSISGCNYPVNLSGVNETSYFLRIPLCWGWATWCDRWNNYERKPESVSHISRDIINYVNFNGAYDYFSQARSNASGKLKTWFIFWYLTLAKTKGLTLFPRYSMVINIGHDGTGSNCGSSSDYNVSLCHERLKLRETRQIENSIALKSHIKFYHSIRGSIIKRILKKFISLVS